jgi:hypothetical protein
MKESHAVNQQVLASFLSGIIVDGGWWFCIPKTYPAPLKKVPLPQDSVMPHFGNVFGITEEAAALVLVEMGLLDK